MIPINCLCAIKYLKKYEDFCVQNNELMHQYYADCCYEMSICYYKMSEFEKAKDSVETSISVYIKNDLKDDLKKSKELLKKIRIKLN